MADKPADKIDWNATGNIVEPSGSRKTSGWVQNKPPGENFNWKWELDTRTALFLLGDSEDWIVIDSVNTDEADYASIAAYVADSPAAGDRLLVKTDEVIAASLIIPVDITVLFLKGVKITTVTDMANAIELSDGVTIEGALLFESSHTGAITNAIIFNGNDINVDLAIGDNKSTGTVNTMFSITAGKVNCFGRGIAKNSGAGTLVSAFVDSSTTDSNHVIVADNPGTTLIRSDGADHVSLADDADLLGGNNSAFYRNAGNLNAGILPAARFNDTAHGTRGGGSLHSEVIAAGASGFMSGADKTKLDGLSSDVIAQRVSTNGNLITNGTFDADTDWVKGTGWSISGGTATASAGVASDLSQTGVIDKDSVLYIVDFTVSGQTSGSVTVKIGNAAGTSRSSNGTFSENITSPGSGQPHDIIFSKDSAFDGSIDDVQILRLTGSTIIPRDDTEIQNNEGDEYFVLKIAPTAGGNKIVLVGGIPLSSNNAQNYMVVATFQDSISDAVAVGWAARVGTPGALADVPIRHEMTAPDTSEIIFKFRCGNNTSGTTTMGGRLGNRIYGGKALPYVEAIEYTT